MEMDKRNLPGGWEWKKLGDVCSQPQYGYTTSGSGEGDIKLLRTTDITSTKEIDWSRVPFCKENPKDVDKFLLYDGDIVISRAGSVGVSFLIANPEPSVFASYLIRFRPKESIISKELFCHFLQSPLYWNEITEKSLGIAIPNVNASKLKEILIPVPPLAVQERIVAEIEALFSELDAGKAALQKAAQQLKTYRQAVLKWAFEGRLTNDAVADGELPEGWKLTKLRELGTWKGGGTPSKSRKDFWLGGTILWVSPKDMKAMYITDTIDKITPAAVENSSANLIPKGSVLFVVRSGILRRILPIALTTSEVTVNQDMQAFTPKEISPEYVYWFAAAANDMIRNTCSKDGTTVESIDTASLKDYEIPVCSLEEQHRIVEEIEARLSVCDKIEETIAESLQQAEALRQSILKKAFEGKLI